MPAALQRSPAARLTSGKQQRKQGTGSDVLLGAAPWAATLWCQVRFQGGETFHKETPAARRVVVAVCARRTDLHLHLAANGLKELALPRHARNNKAGLSTTRTEQQGLSTARTEQQGLSKIRTEQQGLLTKSTEQGLSTT